LLVRFTLRFLFLVLHALDDVVYGEDGHNRLCDQSGNENHIFINILGQNPAACEEKSSRVVMSIEIATASTGFVQMS
jgi:hypothetical protein